MIVTLLSFVLFLIFSVLAGFHYYWLFGGKFGTKQVFPTTDSSTPIPDIPRFATLIVALGLTCIGIVYFFKGGIINVDLPNWITQYALWVIPALFYIRAIGYFNYVGFFKKITVTKFARSDSKIYSPLCLFIGTIGIIIQLL